MRRKLENDLSMIVAVDEAAGFAKGREIRWNFQEDWEHFKNVTKGNVCIMGRATYEDIAERRSKRNAKFKQLLSGRDSYVVSSKLTGTIPQGTEGAFPSTRQILDKLKIPKDDPQEIYILGGFRLFVQHLPSVKQIWMTIVPGNHGCNKYFPVKHLDKDFDIVEGRKTDSGLTFIRYERKRK